ncbi:T9SS type A sorting domain-containing protein [Persicobacter diffluens]|uniref:Secretion system C-terminal sorting domain-containing protein n=1 Tax=Persicobacter diffluens TaxID=981 RepID=A0AAN4W283_9BACT|nr:hypothetical protein PEDI_38250 [Persicobacter diffluens]
MNKLYSFFILILAFPFFCWGQPQINRNKHLQDFGFEESARLKFKNDSIKLAKLKLDWAQYPHHFQQTSSPKRLDSVVRRGVLEDKNKWYRQEIISYDYDEKGRQYQSQTDTVGENSLLSLKSKTRLAFDKQDRIIQNKREEFDPQSKKQIGGHLGNTSFLNVNGYQLETFDWNNAKESWTLSAELLNEKDEEDRTLFWRSLEYNLAGDTTAGFKQINEYLDGGILEERYFLKDDQAWKGENKSYKKYRADGKLMKWEHWGWNTEDQRFLGELRTTNVYKSEQIREQLIYAYDEPLWFPKEKILYRHQVGDTILVKESYYLKKNRWNIYHKAIQLETHNGTATAQYGYEGRESFLIDVDSLVVDDQNRPLLHTSYTAVDGKLIPLCKYEYSYQDRIDQFFTITLRSLWNGKAQQWENAFQETFAVTPNDDFLYEESYQWDRQNQKWTGINKRQNYYDETFHLTGGNIYRWDHEKEDWRGVKRHNFTYDHHRFDTSVFTSYMEWYWNEQQWQWDLMQRDDFDYYDHEQELKWSYHYVWQQGQWELDHSFKYYYQDFVEEEDELVTEVEAEKAKLMLYPNPFSHQLFIKGEEKVEQLNIFSLDGRLMRSLTTDRRVYELSDLPAGVYIVQVQSKDGLLSQKMVKK